MNVKLIPRTSVMLCSVQGHKWVLQRLRRGRSRVEVCERCGAVEKYYDIFREFKA